VIGPESTGKTTLAGRLAAAFDVPWAPEGARTYVEALVARGVTRPLDEADVEPIARLQLAHEDAAADLARRTGRPLVVRDTDLVSTIVYARHYHDSSPAWIAEAARARRAALYLLCDIDVPWAAEGGQRDRSGADPARRTALRDAFIAALGEFGCAFVRLPNEGDARARAAGDAVRALLVRAPTRSREPAGPDRH
jgi:nicotinamide riboside kinase